MIWFRPKSTTDKNTETMMRVTMTTMVKLLTSSFSGHVTFLSSSRDSRTKSNNFITPFP